MSLSEFIDATFVNIYLLIAQVLVTLFLMFERNGILLDFENMLSICLVITAQSAVMPQYVVCLSVCDIQVPWSHRLECFENNFTAEYLKASARADPNMGDLVQWEHPRN